MGKTQRDILLIILFILVLGVVVANIYLIRLLTAQKALTPGDLDPRTRAAETLIPTTGAYWGTYAKPKTGETKYTALTNLEAKIGRKFAIDHQFYRWDNVIPTDYETWTADQGRIPLVNWASHKNDGTVIRWDDIAAGDYDNWIIAQADRVKAFGRPIFMSFQHEPEDQLRSGSYGTAADYRNAWRHIVTVFRNRGANNAVWWWIMTSYEFRARPQEANDLYPGDDMIDWIAADAYNFFTRDGVWRTLEYVVTPFYEWARPHNKPLAFGEWGVEEDPAIPGRKADWFIEAQTLLKSWPEMKAVVYFHSDKMWPWWVDSTPSSLQAYTLVGHDSYFNPQIPSVNPSPSTNPPTNTPVPPTNAPTPTRTPTPVPPTPTPTRTPTPTNTPTPTPTRTPTPIPPTPTAPPQLQSSVVKVYAYGTPSDGVYPTMELIINGSTVRTWTDVRPNFLGFAKEYAYFSPSHLGSGATVRVAFVNDRGPRNSSDGNDRNLKVNRINVDGEDYESEEMFSTGTWSRRGGCNDGYKNSDWLHCNGYFEYPIR